MAENPKDRERQAAMDRERVEAVARAGLPLVDLYGFQFEVATPERAVLRLPETPGIRRPGDVVSGPVLFALADVALWALILAAAGEDMAVTSTLTIDFLAPARRTPLLAEATPLKLGRRSLVGTVHIREAATERLVAHATGTYARPLG